MNVTVENLAPCKKLVRFEVSAEEVEKAFAATAREFAKQAAQNPAHLPRTAGRLTPIFAKSWPLGLLCRMR